MFKFKLGQKAKEKITGFTGIIVARIDYLTGCNRYSLQTEDLYEGKPVDWQNFDENQLELVKEKKEKKPKIKKEKTDKGGPRPSPQKLF